MSKKAIVIGSGIAGIASAIRLQNKGYSVEVFEANAYLGGKMREIQLGAYRFDAGPSLFTLPEFVTELFTLSAKNPSDYFEYKKSNSNCHYFFEDGTTLFFSADQRQISAEIEQKLGVSAQPFEAHLAHSNYIYKHTKGAFLERSLHKFKSYWSKDVFNCLIRFPFLNLFKDMNRVNKKALNHPKLVQIFNRFATYNGSNPYQAPGILNLIPHLELNLGTYFPAKGMRSIPESLIQLAQDLGVVFHVNQKVDEIIYLNKQIKGVRIGDKIWDADIVFCNMDIKLAYQKLLPNERMPKKSEKQEASSSALIFYWGIKKNFPQLDLHNIFFSENYRREFSHIFNEKSVSSDPTVYVHISSKMNPSDAPTGSENWFVMVNVPSNSGQNWETIREKTRANVLKKLSHLLETNIESLIESEDFLDPIRIEERTQSFAGALYGSSSNKRSAAFFRHPNFSKIDGLYFVGGSVHPGGGIPLCLLSAKIASELV